MNRHIGVAMSGGGHRASLWALGAMFYLVDADKQAELSTISSVSGGSITNGVLAQQFATFDGTSADRAKFAAGVQHLIKNIADVGLFHWGPRTNAYLRTTLITAGVGGLGLLGAAIWTMITGLRLGAAICLIASLVVLGIAVVMFERRSLVTDRALAAEHYSTDGKPTLLADAAHEIIHVFCATELQEGRHLYLSPGFVYSWANGVGSPASLNLSTAVQASACLPGAFAARRLPTAPHGFSGGARGTPPHKQLVLVDGGVYDNMGEQWLLGADDRDRAVPKLPKPDIDEVLVVNASALPGWHEIKPSRPALVREVVDLLADKDVMYLQTTSTRRANLVNAWRANAVIGKGQRGALVHIATDLPVAVAATAKEPAPRPTGDPATDARLNAQHLQRMARAEAALKVLEDSKADWAAITRLNKGVGTVLGKLGRVTSVRLLYGSYAAAMCMAHIELGYPLTGLPDPDRFAQLIAPGYRIELADLCRRSPDK